MQPWEMGFLYKYVKKLIANSHDRNRNTKKLNFSGKLFKGKTGSIPGSKV